MPKIVNSLQFTHRIPAFDWLLNNRVGKNQPNLCFGGVKMRASPPNQKLLCICNSVIYIIKR